MGFCLCYKRLSSVHRWSSLSTTTISSPRKEKRMEAENDRNRYLPLYKAAEQGEWITLKAIIDNDPTALTAKMSTGQQTLLHTATAGGRPTEFIRNLTDMLPADAIEIGDVLGYTALHYAAISGNKQVAKILVEKNPKLTQTRSLEHRVPLFDAAILGHKDVVNYLLAVTKDEDPSPFAGTDGVLLLCFLIIVDFYDEAFHLLKRFPALARQRSNDGATALYALAMKPEAFAGGRALGYCQSLVYHYFASKENVPKGSDIENPEGRSGQNHRVLKLIPFLHRIFKIALMHKQSMELFKLLISEAIKAGTPDADYILGPATQEAARLGNQEFVAEVIKSYPPVVWCVDGSTSQNILQLAVKHRQENIYNLLQQTYIRVF